MTKKSTIKCFLKNLLFCTATINVLIIFFYFSNGWFCRRSQVFQSHLKSNKDIVTSRVIIESNRMFDISDFKYLIPKSQCSRNETASYFVVLVCSTPTKFDKRAAIRETWGHSDPRIITYFLMGTVPSESLQRRIDGEEAQYHDIIQGNFVDSYHNLTYKHTMALKWFTENCPNVKYLLKLDDDVFANIPAVHDFLVDNKNNTKYILGPYRPPEQVHRDGKWKVLREDFTDEYFPEFVEGSSVLYSSDFVKDAYKKTFTTRFFWIDDVYVTGLIRMQLNVRIESIDPMLLAGDALSAVLNGSSTEITNAKFLMSAQSLKAQDIRKLWKYTEPIRKKHPSKLTYNFNF